MQGAAIALFWALAGKLGEKFFAKVICGGMREWKKKTANQWDDAISDAFHEAWNVDQPADEKPAA